MTIREFVNEMFDAARVDGNELMTLDTAKTDLANYRAEGWELPEDITPEAYMEAWNELVNEQNPKTAIVYADGPFNYEVRGQQAVEAAAAFQEKYDTLMRTYHGPRVYLLQDLSDIREEIAKKYNVEIH